MAYILGFLRSLWDVALAAYDIVTRRSRRRYTHQTVINAPKETVRSLITGADITFARANLRCVEEPLPGVEGAVVTRTFVGGEAKSAIASRRIEDTEDSAVVQYLPEYSENAATIGTDAVFGAAFEALPGGSTRLHLYRELTHRRPATRITAPLGLRVLAWLVKTEAESREGTAPGTARRWLTQAAWLVAALASFWWLAGWKDAVLLVVLIVLHEAGHALAMWITGRGVRFITLIPFIGGMAVPKRMYESDAQHAFVALMGPGMSLLPTAGIIWFAYGNDSQLAAHAGFMFALINGLNLLPLTPLDGGVAANALLHAIHRRLALAIAWLSTTAGLVLAFYLQSVILGVVFVFAGLQLIQQASLGMHLQRKRLRWFQAPLVLGALVLTFCAYVMAFVHGSKLQDTVALLAPPEANAGAARGDEEPSHCWMPATSGQALEAYLETQLQIDDWKATPLILAAAEIAGPRGAVERWLTQNAARKLETQISSGTVADLGAGLRLARAGPVEEIRAFMARNSKDDDAGYQLVIRLLVLNGRYGEAAALVMANPDKVTKPALIRELLRAGAWERAVAFHESQTLSREMLQVTGEIANAMSEMNRKAEARSFLERLTARARQAPERGASSFWPPEALYWLVRLGATDIALPADDNTTEPWALAAVAFRAAQLEDTGDKAGAQALLASFAKAAAENPGGAAKAETRPSVREMIEDQLAPARAIVKLERGGLSVAEAFASSGVDYEEEVPLRAEYLRQGRFSDVEAYDLRLNAKPVGLAALLAILVPPAFDAAATQRYMEFAFAAAKRGGFETASRFAARAGRLLCYVHPKAQNGGLWRAWFTLRMFVLKAAEEGRLAPAVLNQF